MKQGKLKIFFGYCAGVGKTYAMLEAAHERRREGMDVVIGYIEKHDRYVYHNPLHEEDLRIVRNNDPTLSRRNSIYNQTQHLQIATYISIPLWDIKNNH